MPSKIEIEEKYLFAYIVATILAFHYYNTHFHKGYIGTLYVNIVEIVLYCSIIIFILFRKELNNVLTLRRALIGFLGIAFIFLLTFGNVWRSSTILYALPSYASTFIFCFYFFSKWMKPFDVGIFAFWSIFSLSYIYELPIAISNILNGGQAWLYYAHFYSNGFLCFGILLEGIIQLKNWNKKEILLAIIGFGFLAFEWILVLINKPNSIAYQLSRSIASIFFILLSIRIA